MSVLIKILTFDAKIAGCFWISKHITYEKGSYDEEIIFLHCTVIPSWDDPREFVVELFYKDLILPEFEEKKQTIARIDNKSHGGDPHLDKEFEENPSKEFRDWNVYSAWEHLQKKWRDFSKKYFRNHIKN